MSPGCIRMPGGFEFGINFSFKRALPLVLEVNRLAEIRNRPSIIWKIGADSGAASPAGVASEIKERLIQIIYGKNIDPGVLSEQFSIATIIDAADIVVTDPILESGPLHYALEGLTGWKPKWKIIQPEQKSLETCKIPSASAPAGHILYGKSRS